MCNTGSKKITKQQGKDITHITIFHERLPHEMVVCRMTCFVTVNNAVQVRKVSVQIDALGIFTSSGPAIAVVLTASQSQLHIILQISALLITTRT